MDFDFNLILVPVTLIFFVIWLLDKLVFKQRKTNGKGNESTLVSWAYDFWPVLAVVLFVRSFLYEPYNIPSSSMKPSLYTGDFILVKKYAYGVRLPLVHSKVLDTGSPKHGDVAVFRYPDEPEISYIKRIVGLPGDTLTFENGDLSINGKVQSKLQNSDITTDTFSTIYNETLGESTHLMRDMNGVEAAANAPFITQENPAYAAKSPLESWKITVPEGNYFVMGDNRDESADSRFWGFVPEKNLSGKATYVWMHKKPGLHLPSFSNARKIQ